MLIMSKKAFDRLPADQQKAVDQAGREAVTFMRGAWTVSEVTAHAALKSKFKEIITVDKGPSLRLLLNWRLKKAKDLA